MNRLAFLAVAAPLAFGFGSSPSPDWTKAYPLRNHSIFKVTINETGGCTAWGLDRAAYLLVTASHCVEDYDTQEPYDSLSVEGKDVKVIAVNHDLDIALIRVKGLYIIPLKVAETAPLVGSEVCLIGHGFGDETPYLSVGHIASMDPYQFEKTSGYVIFASVIGGMSGGPILNSKLEVVSIVQMGGHGHAFNMAEGIATPDLVEWLRSVTTV